MTRQTPEKIVAFVGPTIPSQDRLSYLEITFAPPARRGDIERAVENGCTTILLVDGVMINEYPPSPTEIAYAMEKGITVVGAASLGALRAVELVRLGMLGVGWVFRKYLSGEISRDDELLVSFDADSYRSFTHPLINLRYAIEQMILTDALSANVGNAFLEHCSRLYFADRNSLAIRDIALQAGLSVPQVIELLNPRYDVKRRDARIAIGLLRRITVDALSRASQKRRTRKTWTCEFQASLQDAITASEINRVGDTTGFDRTFIPTSVAVKCGTLDPIWVYSGKAESLEQARLVAVMEALERTTALWNDAGFQTSSKDSLPSGQTVWDASDFTYGPSGSPNALWCRASGVGSGQPIWVPADMIFFGSRPVGLPPSPFVVGTTNGLAAHISKERAILAGC